MSESDITVVATVLFPRLVRDVPLLMFLYEALQTDKFPAIRDRLKEWEAQLAQADTDNAV